VAGTIKLGVLRKVLRLAERKASNNAVPTSTPMRTDETSALILKYPRK